MRVGVRDSIAVGVRDSIRVGVMGIITDRVRIFLVLGSVWQKMKCRLSK